LIIDGKDASASAGILIESKTGGSPGTYVLTTIRLLLTGTSVPDGDLGSDVDCVGTAGKVFSFDDAWVNDVAKDGGVASGLVLVKLVDPAPGDMLRSTLHITLDGATTTVTPPSTGLGSFHVTGAAQASPAYSFAPLARSTEPFCPCDFDGNPRRELEGSLARGTGSSSDLSGWAMVVDCNDADGRTFAISMADAIGAIRAVLA